ncbi:MAG TPA: hypothetical protein VFB21_18635 [Chthonomonadaceae bacterium]|nr:hypothetical protein [Chthonomonadaceae bacterium]
MRDDGSTTWSKLAARFAFHDLTHYVAETTLGCRNAFYGLIAQGWDIETFTAIDPATGTRPELPAEANQIEGLITTLQSQLWNGASYEEIVGLWEMSCASFGLPPPRLTPEQLDTIRERLRACWEQWKLLPAGGVLELPFPG